MISRRRKTSSGFTIVEASISVAIVGILLVASTGTFTSIAQVRRVQVERRQAYMLAQQLMAEIQQQYFQSAGTGTLLGVIFGTPRSSFTGVNQYDAYTASPPTNQAGTALSDYAGWTESVSVVYVDPNNPGTVLSVSTLKRITVTVISPTGKQYLLVGLRSQFGAYEAIPPVQTNYVTGVAVTVQGAFPAKTIVTGAHPLNITSSQ